MTTACGGFLLGGSHSVQGMTLPSPLRHSVGLSSAGRGLAVEVQLATSSSVSRESSSVASVSQDMN